MNQQIIDNLFEFWSLLGLKSKLLIKKENYKAVMVENSDFGKRVFDIKDKGIITDIIDKIKSKLLPNIITLSKPNELEREPDAKFMFGQRNMALDLNDYQADSNTSSNIYHVKTVEEILQFAQIASESFGYKVDGDLIKLIANEPEINLFVYRKEEETLGCGLVFFDSNNNAGLHMIGTIPAGRGMGIGKSITEYLLKEAKDKQCKFCVLHASLMGEKIYSRLGFVPYGELATYRINH